MKKAGHSVWALLVGVTLLCTAGAVAGQGTVQGTGTRVIEGTLAPGNSPGCVTDQGNVVFEGNALLEIELAGPTPCSGHDQYNVALSLRLNGPTLRVLLIGGFVPEAGQRFDILNWGSLTGTFGTLQLPELPAGLSWDTSGLYVTGELQVQGPTSLDSDVPLPAWALLMLGGGLLAMVARRRRG